MTTGSLGQGLSAANGMALAAKLDGQAQRWVYVLLGDGELQEGQIWEAAMTAAHYKLDNLIAFVDRNDLQIDGRVSAVMGVDPVGDKFRAFGWHVQEIDGHDFDQILAAVDAAKAVAGKPSVIIARTVKGKGVSFMEGQSAWHGRCPTEAEYKQALAELGEQGGAEV
jgi:transketolase